MREQCRHDDDPDRCEQAWSPSLSYRRLVQLAVRDRCSLHDGDPALDAYRK